jgi:hypothetical protein
LQLYLRANHMLPALSCQVEEALSDPPMPTRKWSGAPPKSSRPSFRESGFSGTTGYVTRDLSATIFALLRILVASVSLFVNLERGIKVNAARDTARAAHADITVLEGNRKHPAASGARVCRAVVLRVHPEGTPWRQGLKRRAPFPGSSLLPAEECCRAHQLRPGRCGILRQRH